MAQTAWRPGPGAPGQEAGQSTDEFLLSLRDPDKKPSGLTATDSPGTRGQARVSPPIRPSPQVDRTQVLWR